MYGWPSSSPMSKTATMCGWAPRRPIACASRRTRARAGRVEALGLDERERDLAVEVRVVREVDALLAALAEQPHELVATAGDRARSDGGSGCVGGEGGATVAAEPLAGRVGRAAARATRHEATLLWTNRRRR